MDAAGEYHNEIQSTTPTSDDFSETNSPTSRSIYIFFYVETVNNIADPLRGGILAAAESGSLNLLLSHSTIGSCCQAHHVVLLVVNALTSARREQLFSTLDLQIGIKRRNVVSPDQPHTRPHYFQHTPVDNGYSVRINAQLLLEYAIVLEQYKRR